MIDYCGKNESFLPIWNEGISPCLYHTVAPGLLLIVPLIMCIYHHCTKRRFLKKSLNTNESDVAHLVDSEEELGDVPEVAVLNRTCSFQGFSFSRLPVPFLYACQAFLHILLILQPIVNIIVKVVMCPDCLSGAEILHNAMNLVCWIVAMKALIIERKYYFCRKIKNHSIPMLMFWTLALLLEILIFVSWNNKNWHLMDSGTDYLDLIMLSLKCAFTFGLFIHGLFAPGLYKSKYDHINDDIDKENSETKSSMAEVWEKVKKLYPFIWPDNNLLRVRVFVCFLLLISSRIINVFVPLQYKKIINYLTDKDNKDDPWKLILFYMFLAFLQGGGGSISMGIISNLRSFLWVKVQQYTSRSVQRQLFEHLHNLSLRWHLSRKTGEVIRMVDRGATSIENLLSYLLFQILPTIVDIIIALVFFGAVFNGWFALIVFGTMSLYIFCTIAVTEWRTKYRRDMNTKDNITKAIAVDSLLNFETVKYYNNEAFEVKRYDEKIKDFLSSQWWTLMSLNLLNTAQNFVITGGLLGGMLYCGTLVSEGRLTIGDFVLFMSYMKQLYAPLNFFGTYYRLIQSAFIDMENMFELFDEKVEIKDHLDSYQIQIREGLVEFQNVHFSYDEARPILKGISFRVHPGQSIALVGPSGSGKSTIIRLLFRFYEVNAGNILIDGQDIKGVTQKSLRQLIGVVPQDTVLFNDTIKYNIAYGRIGSSDERIEEASQSADIHHKIETFTSGYDTMVGERGLKLSGGEKQRVAIARTMLKAPEIILLDEATSALDTQTERNIQASLDKICANKTSIVVAHRLSTVIGSDQILVLKDGVIVERGKHYELLEMEGMYAKMWNQQLQEDVVEE